MRRLFLTLLLPAILAGPLLSQGIRGEILDREGRPVPYAAIFIKELTRGTTCNALGQFSLPLPPGNYTVFFRSLGYTEVTRTLEVEDGFIELEIVLPPQTYMIPEVRVSASGEDPAYWIMRKTIGLANYHLNEVLSYTAEIYIKGSALIDQIPRAIARRIEVNDIEVKEDKAYMLESLNEVSFTAPDNYEMKVLASQNTLPGYTDNVNPMDYINASLYQQEIEGIISPLARTAFSYYRFTFEGTFLEGTYVVNKIRVTPKRKSQQLVEGFLYIVEDLWCIHSSDLSVNTIAGTVYLEQLYANVIMDAWLPVNHKIRADVQIAGIKGSVTYVSSLEYSDVTLNPNLPETYFTSTGEPRNQSEVPDQPEEEVSREQEKIAELLQKEELSNRDAARLSRLMEKEAEKGREESPEEDLNQTGTTFTVAENAVKNDSLYWSRIRPIPLTPEEQVTLQARDSVLAITRPAGGGDSARVNRRRGTPLRNLVNGQTYLKRRGRLRFTYGGLVDLQRLGYNTVDGIYYGQNFSLDWRPDSLKAIRSNLLAGFAFHRKSPQIRWDSDLLYAPMRRGKVALYLNYRSSDFNGTSGIPHPTNMVYTLFLRENYLKMYHLIDARLYNRIDIVNGLVLENSLSVGLRETLQNHSYFSFFFRNAEEERFTPNVPEGRGRGAPELSGHRRFVASIRLQYTPEHYYVVRNFRKSMRDSRYPTFHVSYRQALPLEGTGWSSFGEVSGGLRHTFDVGLLSEMEWSVQAGFFPDTTSVHFSDYRHFKSSPLYVDMAGLNRSLMLIDYYAPSTTDPWIRSHATLTSSYLLIKFLPWFSERLWRESIDLGYLHTRQTGHYLQAGYSLREIFFLVDLGIYAGFGENLRDREDGFGFRGVTGRINFRF